MASCHCYWFVSVRSLARPVRQRRQSAWLWSSKLDIHLAGDGERSSVPAAWARFEPMPFGQQLLEPQPLGGVILVHLYVGYALGTLLSLDQSHRGSTSKLTQPSASRPASLLPRAHLRYVGSLASMWAATLRSVASLTPTCRSFTSRCVSASLAAVERTVWVAAQVSRKTWWRCCQGTWSATTK